MHVRRGAVRRRMLPAALVLAVAVLVSATGSLAAPAGPPTTQGEGGGDANVDNRKGRR